MTMGQRIRGLRKKRGLTQEKLGELCGISGAAIGSYEADSTVPKLRVVEKLAQALGVSPSVILEENLPAVQPDEHTRVPESNTLLFHGILGALKELFGTVEGRVIADGNGNYVKYYVVEQGGNSFVLYEQDIAALVRSTRASMFPLVKHMRKACRGDAP